MLNKTTFAPTANEPPEARQVDDQQSVPTTHLSSIGMAVFRTHPAAMLSMRSLPMKIPAFLGFGVLVLPNAGVSRVPAPVAQTDVISPQCLTLDTKVVPPLNAGVQQFGYAIDIDGDTAVVGVRIANSPYVACGVAYVFERSAGNWIQTAILQSPMPHYFELFGDAVAIDGGTVAIGARGHVPKRTLNNSGAIFLFEKLGGVWTQVEKIQASDPLPGSHLGCSVSLDGNTLVAGAFTHTPFNGSVYVTAAGAAYVFVRNGSNWSQQAKLLPGDLSSTGFPYAEFGTSVCVRGDTVIVGIPRLDLTSALVDAGAAYVYTRSNGAWTQQAKLLSSAPESGEKFGQSVAFDEERAVIGAPYGVLDPDGWAYAFQRTGSMWSQGTQIVPSGNRGLFGKSVSLLGATCLVSAPSGWGTVYIYQWLGSQWVEQTFLALNPNYMDPPPFLAGLGDSTALTHTHIAASAHGDPNNMGAAYIYHFASPPRSYCTSFADQSTCSAALSWQGTPSATKLQPFTITASSVPNNKQGLFLYSTQGSAFVPLGGSTLCVKLPVVRTALQATGGNPPPDDCSGQMSFDLNAWIQAGNDPALTVGTGVFGQYWYREPASPSGASLSPGIELYLCP